MKNYQARIEMLQETHKYLDRQCTDLQKKNGNSISKETKGRYDKRYYCFSWYRY